MTKKIYLSPSNQCSNTYATGNTNEMAQCDKIANATATALKRCGFDVKVGKSGDSMQNRCNESDNFKADIHMPIHTNACNGKVTGGTRIFVLDSARKSAGQAVLNALGPISPGTADSLTYKTDLYEINVPNALTIYVEVEFHDTKTGSDWIRNNTTKIGEAICKGLCSYFGVTYKSATATTSTAKTSTATSGSSAIKSVQTWLNTNHNAKLTVDGIYGAKTKAAIVKALQTYLNKTYSAKLVVDGIMGAKTKAAVRNVKSGATGTYVRILQAALICNGYDTGGFDGICGTKTVAAVKSYQTKKKLVVDGIAGQNTFYSLLVA